MSNMRYTLEDLQEFDERAYEKACALGLKPPTTEFMLVPAEEMYDIAARGLPGRYSHYQFGRAYEEMKRGYDTGKSRIYELVVNTRPVHAYLLEGNSIIAQLLVIAHVYGHAVMYEYNTYFGPSDKNILSRVTSAAERIDRYIVANGRIEVENFIDSCEALQFNASFDQLGKKRTPHEPKFEPKEFDILFPEETDKRRAEYLEEKEDYRFAFPKAPERDVLRFIEEHSPRLEDWQKDIISIIRTEREYFTPQMRSKVLHEGVATLYHQRIVQELMAEDERFTSDDFMEFQGMNARVLHPVIHVEEDPFSDEKMVHCDDYNPYLLGYTILQELERICLKPTKDEKEKWPWAGEADPQEKRNEIIQAYDDTALLYEFITPNVCEQAKLFMEPRPVAKYKKLHVGEEEAEEVRQLLVRRAMTRNSPVVEIIDGDGRARGELWLEHRIDPEYEVGLDPEYARGTLRHLSTLWGRTCVIHTINDEKKKIWYVCKPGQKTTSHLSTNF